MFDNTILQLVFVTAVLVFLATAGIYEHWLGKAQRRLTSTEYKLANLAGEHSIALREQADLQRRYNKLDETHAATAEAFVALDQDYMSVMAEHENCPVPLSLATPLEADVVDLFPRVSASVIDQVAEWRSPKANAEQAKLPFNVLDYSGE